MKKFSLDVHNKKYMDLAKQAAIGTYPSKKVAQVGSIIGGILGVILILVGIVSNLGGHTWGLGCLIAGVVTCMSNFFNLKRLRSR